MLTYRETKPCPHCESEAPICSRTRRACRETVARLEREAIVAGERTPSGEVVFDCLTFRTKRRTP